MSRTIRTFLALLCTIFDDLSVTKKYLYLTQNDFKPDQAQEEQDEKMMVSLIIVILSICIIVLVQARIVFMKWNNPEQLNIAQMMIAMI